MFYNSIKEINRLKKETNRLLSKGMSNIYLIVTIEKRWHTQNCDFKSLKSLPGQFLMTSNSHRHRWIFKPLVATEKSRSGSKTMCGFSITFIFKGHFEFNELMLFVE